MKFPSHLMRPVASLFLLSIGFIAMISCEDDKHGTNGFKPDSPIEVINFYPDSGGIATPIIIEGSNFGTDTIGMRVYFKDTLGVRHRAGLVSSNGTKIYAFVPKLTYLNRMKVLVERETDNGAVVGTAVDDFLYKTQTTVSTVVGHPEPDNDNVSTVGGTFASSTLSAPCAIAVDNEDNIFITERDIETQRVGSIGIAPKNDKGEKVDGNIVMADTKNESVIVLKYASNKSNAPAFSNQEGAKAVYVPADDGLYYYALSQSLSYAPRRRSLITNTESENIIKENWKYSFVVNKLDNMVYSVMWKGQLIRFNPSTRSVEVLLDKVIPDVPNARGKNGTNAYCVFSPLEPNMLYICQEDYNIISRVDVSKLADKDKTTYKGEMYAGKSILEGPTAGHGWEDGLLQNARFYAPKQICFTADAKLYIADTNNHCIRVIDTTVSPDKATVMTAIGLPNSPGFKDGGPEIAKFNFPSGVAVSSDGSVIYVADSKNKVIRKLSVE